MEFKITTSSYFYEDKDEMEQLKKLGFTFEKPFNSGLNEKRRVIRGKGKKTINSIEELMDFQKEYGELIINDREIEIYDGYRE